MKSCLSEDGVKGSAHPNIKWLWEISASHCFDLAFIPPSRQKERQQRPGVKSTFHSPLTSVSARSIPPLFTVSFCFFLLCWERVREADGSPKTRLRFEAKDVSFATRTHNRSDHWFSQFLKAQFTWNEKSFIIYSALCILKAVCLPFFLLWNTKRHISQKCLGNTLFW